MSEENEAASNEAILTSEEVQKVNLQQQLLVAQAEQQLNLLHQQYHRSPTATTLFYPTVPGALSVGKFPNPASVVRFLAGNNLEAQKFLSRKAQVIIRMRGLPYDASSKQVVSNVLLVGIYFPISFLTRLKSYNQYPHDLHIHTKFSEF